jgi:PAS domain-containing protein
MTTNPYFHIFESIPLGIVVIDAHGHIQTMNRYAKTILDIADTDIKDEPPQCPAGPPSHCKSIAGWTYRRQRRDENKA